jgi:hypothetical protein
MTMQSCYSQQLFEHDDFKEDPGDVEVAPSKVCSLCEVSGEEAIKDTGGAWVEPQGSPSERASSMEIELGVNKTKLRMLGSIQQDDPLERRPRKRLRRAGATIVEDGSPSTDEKERKDIGPLGAPMVRGAIRTIQGLCRTRAEKRMT